MIHAVKGLGPGGAEKLIVNQVTSSVDEAIAYSVVRILDHKDHLVDDLSAAAVPVTSVGAGPGWPIRLARHLRAVDADVVHAHSPLLAAQIRLLRRFRVIGSRIVTTEHNRWPRHHRLTRLANRATLALDDATIAVSDDVRASMSETRRSRVQVVRHGIVRDRVIESAGSGDRIRDELGIAADDVVVGIVANFRPEKGYDVLLAAARIACAERTDLRVVAVGQGPGEADFRRSVASADLGGRVIVTGYRPDAAAVLAACDIFTLSSRHEGLPVALMEALALGLPVVATRAGGIPEAVTEGVEGQLVPVDDAEALARGWLALAEDPDLRIRLGQAALVRSADFDASLSTREIESVYRRLITGAG